MATITTFKGKTCTAVPKKANNQLLSSFSSSSSSTSISTSTSTSSISISTSTSTSIPSTISTSTLVASSTSSPPASTTIGGGVVQNPLADVLAPSSVPPEAPSSTTSTTSTASLRSSLVSQTDLVSPTPISTSASQTITVTSSDAASSTSEASSPSQPDNQTEDPGRLADSSSTSTQSSTGQTSDSITLTSSAGSAVVLTTGDAQPTGPSPETETSGVGLPNGNKAVAITTGQTIAIAVGVIGGVVIISLIAFLIWLWRKRRLQGRRNTLLTPLSPSATFRPDEKAPYLTGRSPIGPTALSEKLWAVVGMRYKRLRGRVSDIVARDGSPSPSINLDRGNSQFGPPSVAHSRDNSNVIGAAGGPSSTKGRFVDWWGRLTEDGNFNWRLRHESKGEPTSKDAFAATRPANGGNGPSISLQPDFLALMSMDDKQLDRESARGRGSVNGNQQRRSISAGNEQHFLGGLGLNFDMADPFSDVNAVGNNTASATPLVVSAANNPFSDANAITAPSSAVNGGLTTYVQNIRRSRGHSVNVGGISCQASTVGTRMNSVYRESSASVDTTGTRRNKFRSDPFDLDRPDLLQSANSSTAPLAGRSSIAGRGSRSIRGLPNTPKQAHVRAESFTSKYSSGVSGISMGEWSDPGPDVGPAAARFTPSPDSALGRQDSKIRKRGSSQGSVGKAL
ncbi:hypothetical protein GGR54DRAFT_418703 [Hypoxylon sp. NC1633]|nr:hypothetical protein GGR54DRAFT_418703 [Hypoxylon sp. NC1633]